MEKYLLIPVKGDVKVVELDEEILLSELQRLVDGYIETIPYTKDMLMIVNDEGVINEMPFNGRASALIKNHLFGPVVIAGRGLRNGEPDIVGLSERDCNILQLLIETMIPQYPYKKSP